MSRQGKIRSRFKDAEVKFARNAAADANDVVDYEKMATILSNNTHGTVVTRQLARYWAKQFNFKKKNGDDYVTLAPANKALKEERKLREPSLDDFKPQAELKQDDIHHSILVIPDLHAPYHHPDTIIFLKEVARHYGVKTVVNLGDETDHHGLSYHDSDPNLDSAGVELTKAREFLAELERLFPQMKVCHSNHGSMLHRKAKTHGIPADMLKSYREVLFPEGQGQGWEWDYSFRLALPNGDDVLFKHQASGDLLAAAAHERCNLVIGHLHAKYGIEYSASTACLYWAMHGGCLIDAKSLAFAYGENFKHKPIIGCSVIVDSLPILVPMRLGEDGRWIGKL